MIRRAWLLATAALLAFATGSSVQPRITSADVPTQIGNVSLQSACDYGITAAFHGELTRAESAFVQVLDQRPRDSRVLTNLGNLKIINGDARVALSFYDAAALADSNDAGIVLNQATALYLLGDTTAANLTYARGIELAGGFQQAADLLGLYVESDEPGSRAADKSRLQKDEQFRRLDRAMKLIPADTPSTPADSTHLRRKRAHIQRTRYRIGAARAGEETTASVLYWAR